MIIVLRDSISVLWRINRNGCVVCGEVGVDTTTLSSTIPSGNRGACEFLEQKKSCVKNKIDFYLFPRQDLFRVGDVTKERFATEIGKPMASF